MKLPRHFLLCHSLSKIQKDTEEPQVTTQRKRQTQLNETIPLWSQQAGQRIYKGTRTVFVEHRQNWKLIFMPSFGYFYLCKSTENKLCFCCFDKVLNARQCCPVNVKIGNISTWNFGRKYSFVKHKGGLKMCFANVSAWNFFKKLSFVHFTRELFEESQKEVSSELFADIDAKVKLNRT